MKNNMVDIGGILSGTASLFNAFASIGAGKREEKRQKRLMQFQDEIADENYQKQLEDQRQLIAEDREYNSIGQQMRRAREGGVSGLAALGVSSGNSISAQSPSQGAPSIPSGGLRDSLTGVAQGLSGAVEDFLNVKLKREQVKAAEIENRYREERLRNENALAAASVKTQESIDNWYQTDAKKNEQMTKLYEQQTEVQRLLADYQENANPALISKAYQEFSNSLAEGQRMDIENSTLRQRIAISMRNQLSELYLRYKQANWYSVDSQNKKDWLSWEKNKYSQQKELQSALISLQQAHQAYLEDMSSSEKWKNYMSALHGVASILSVAVQAKGLSMQGNQMKPVKGNTGTYLDDIPDFPGVNSSYGAPGL